MIRALICLALCATVLAQTPSCGQIKAKDGSTYDLTALTGIFHAPQKGVGQDQNNYVYNITICGSSPYPCGNGACSGANTAGVCQTWSDNAGQHGKCAGKYDSTASAVGMDGGKGVQISYDNGDLCGSCNPSGPRGTVLYLMCDKAATTGLNFQSVIGGAMGGSNIFYINATSSHACPGGASIDGGWIFIIIVVCLLFVYFVGGVIFNAAVRKQSGKEMVPNSEFWCDLPSLIGDGFKFLIGKCTGRGSGYTPVSA